MHGRKTLLLSIGVCWSLLAVSQDIALVPAIRALSDGEYAFAENKFRAASETGSVEATYYLGLMHLDGLGVEENSAIAATHLKAAADAGYAPAQYRYGQLLRYGEQMPLNRVAAATLLQAAADQGHKNAQCTYARMLYTGEGVDKDIPRSLQYASTHPDLSDCQLVLGLHSYLGDKRTKPNYAQALKYFKAAAEDGDAEAPLLVGLLYDHGLGVPRDSVEANRWIKMGIDRGDKQAVGYLTHKNAASAAQFAVGMEIRRMRAEKKRERQKFWAEVSNTLVAAMPAVTEALSQYSQEQQQAALRESAWLASQASAQAPQNRLSTPPRPTEAVATPMQATSPQQAQASRAAAQPAARPSNDIRNETSSPKVSVEIINWPEAVVVCPRPKKDQSLMGASSCQGPRGFAFVDRVTTDINMTEINRACSSSAREIGWIDDHRVFGCDYGINPTKSSSTGHYDQGERMGLVIPSRQTYRCAANQYDPCRSR